MGKRPPTVDAEALPVTPEIGKDGLPPDCPSARDIRTLVAYLTYLCPADSVHALIQARDYTAAHELTGFHEAIQSLRALAELVDEVNSKDPPAAEADGL